MSFSDSDWTTEAEAPPSLRYRQAMSARMALVIGLAAGVAIGAAAAALLMRTAAPPEAAPAALAAAPAAATSAAAPATEQHAALPAAAVATPAPADAPAASAESTQVAPASAQVRKPSEEEARRKERAWARWYRRPPSCEGQPTTDQLIECANHFIRSKREFDERWRAGML